MLRLRRSILLTAAWLIASASSAQANARLVSVVPLDADCVSGPNGGSVQFWEVEPGKRYSLTISHVLDCANGGTDATIGVRLNSSGVGNTDVVAVLVATGTYRFEFTVPEKAVCTMPIFYCTTPGMSNTGLRVQRNDGENFQAHLRMASFGAGCLNPTTISGTDCLRTPTRSRTWSQVKRIYR